MLQIYRKPPPKKKKTLSLEKKMKSYWFKLQQKSYEKWRKQHSASKISEAQGDIVGGPCSWQEDPFWERPNKVCPVNWGALHFPLPLLAVKVQPSS